MLDLLLQRWTVVTLGIMGGILSIFVTALSARGVLSEPVLKLLNQAAYVFMGLSMCLFIAAGLA